jgi:alkanesulfonate monooxygenase SsuD/methylene tetrahydromethanopterin reductase-like flavin-dependent oxidoreductase (luciferase family)
MSRIRLVHVLSENWTLTPPRDLRALVRMAQEAEEAGFDAVMSSEHVVLGRDADLNGLMANPRDYALPGNQDPAMPWPSSLVLLSAIASATTRLRLAAAAIIAPLRHPLLLAKDLATLDLLSEGRLVVLPTVSWHEAEYTALGVPFTRRGSLLDEHLAAWHAAWGASPSSFAGRFYRFDDVWLEPKPFRPDGIRLWFGSTTLHDQRSNGSSATGTAGIRSVRRQRTTSGASTPRLPRPVATSPSSSSSAAHVAAFATRTRWPTWTRRSRRSQRRSSAASRRSASSPRSSSTTRRGTPHGAVTSWPGSMR